MQFQRVRLTQLRPWHHVAIFLLAFVVIVLRRPDAVLHAQFWAEDGHVWYADAYNLGWWPALFRAQDGYFQTLPRLAAAFALLLPLSLAPLALNVAAICIQALPVNLLLKSCSTAWGSLRFRALLAGIYLALPNSREMDAIVSSSQWLLALCAFLLLVAATPERVAGRLFVISALLLCGLSGPFCFFLLPVAVFLAWRNRDRWRALLASLLAVPCLLQACGLLLVNHSGRAHAILGATPGLFVRILAGHVFLGALIGSNVLASNPSLGLFIFLLCIAILGIAVTAACCADACIEMKIFVLFSFVLLTAACISPAAYPPPGVSRWDLLVHTPGIRYWFFPTLAFAWSIAYLLVSSKPLLKLAGSYLLFFLCIAIIRGWEYPAFKDLNFAEDAKRVESARPGTEFTLPQNPDGWTIRLAKRHGRQ
ncbi:MAG TPA: hypothetical protein VGG85_07450 [Terracidiphilus sp.]|jgi:hypothetical protein